ncbi:hypothetical protein [Bradyrhizobium sp. USDA 4486]
MLARASTIPAPVLRPDFCSDACFGAIGGAVSTVIENLLARKQKLVEQLEKASSAEDRDKLEHQLEQINTALDFLDRPGSRDAR